MLVQNKFIEKLHKWNMEYDFCFFCENYEHTDDCPMKLIECRRVAGCNQQHRQGDPEHHHPRCYSHDENGQCLITDIYGGICA